MIFRLYSASNGGVSLWEEQWTGPNSVQVSDGLFNVMLGNLTPIPQSVVTGNSNLWLGITVGADDEMSPRVQLGSVPYAAQALTVPDGTIDTAKLADHSVTQAKLGADISLAPADGSITTAKLADNAVTSAKIADGIVSSTDIADSSIATVDLANGAVTDAKANLSYVYPSGNNVALKGNVLFMNSDVGFAPISGRGDGGLAMVLDTNDTLKINYANQFSGGLVAFNFRTAGVVEENLQTEQEKNQPKIDRFSQGDVLCWDANEGQLEKCSISGSPLIVAVADVNGRPIILGAEPVKVVGPINAGDLLISSDSPGYARAWNENGLPPAGIVIGKALESCETSICMIKVLIQGR